MDKKDLKKLWKIFLVNTNCTNAKIAEEEGCTPQTFGKKINSATIRLLDIANIFERHGYRLDLVKDEKQHQNRYNKKGHKKRPAKWQAFLIVLFAIYRSTTKLDIIKVKE